VTAEEKLRRHVDRAVEAMQEAERDWLREWEKRPVSSRERVRARGAYAGAGQCLRLLLNELHEHDRGAE